MVASRVHFLVLRLDWFSGSWPVSGAQIVDALDVCKRAVKDFWVPRPVRDDGLLRLPLLRYPVCLHLLLFEYVMNLSRHFLVVGVRFHLLEIALRH